MSVVASIRSQLVPIHREGYPFIGVFALVSLILFLVLVAARLARDARDRLVCAISFAIRRA